MVATVLDPRVKSEIHRLVRDGKPDVQSLEDFACLVIQVETEPKPQPLPLSALKQALYEKFEVTTTAQLRKDGCFRGLTHGMGKFDFRFKATWKRLYRKLIGILPDEQNQQGYGCINGINIFNYFRPWQVFDLDPKTTTSTDVRQAYHRLAKVYHPDNLNTGDRSIFEELEIMYRSLLFIKKD